MSDILISGSGSVGGKNGNVTTVSSVVRQEERKLRIMSKFKTGDKDTTLKSGPLEGRKVTSKRLEVDGVIFWNSQYDDYRVKLNDGSVTCLTDLFELVGDDPVESKSDDRIDTIEKRVAELEKKANPPKSEEAIIREFEESLYDQGIIKQSIQGLSIKDCMETYIKEVLNK